MKYIIPLILMTVFCATSVMAQTSPKAEKPAPQTPPQAPKAEAQAEKPSALKKPKIKAPKTVKDLDAFFKEGEEQVKDGPRCDIPPAPVA